MYTSVYAYPWDILDESPRGFCDAVKQRLGVDTVSMAVSYHAAKLLLPHNPRRKVYYPEDGALYFRPDPTAFAASPIKPRLSALTDEQDCLAALCDAATDAGLGVIAWTVCLHNTYLGEAYPEYTPRTAFGDPIPHYFCPSQPAAHAYVCALASDIARRYPVRSIQLEALHYLPFAHGFHHEMQQVRLTPALHVLLGLCFCPACLDLARESGVDGARVQRYVVAEAERLFAAGGGAAEPVAWQLAYWQDHLDGEMGRYLSLRAEAVAGLLADVSQAVHAVSNVAVYPQEAAAILPSAHRPVVENGWLTGTAAPPRAGTADGIAILGYVAGSERFQAEMEAYRARIPATLPIEIALRPAPPDCASADELAAKVACCVELGAAGLSFYNYGQMPETSMDWVHDALAQAGLLRS